MSKEADRTPGMWVADTSGEYSKHARVNSVEKLICSVGNGENPDIAFDEWCANAHLIAAAPELLEYSKLYMATVNQMNAAMMDGVNVHGALANIIGAGDMLKYAIAKAEGGAS